MTVLNQLYAIIFGIVAIHLSLVAAVPHPHYGHVNLLARRAASVNETETLELRTNAARMAAGFGPISPRALYAPSRVSARTPATSSVPCLTGSIKITKCTGEDVVGYLGKTYASNKFAIVSASSAASNRLGISFTPTTSALFGIDITTSGFSTYPKLGFAGADATLSSSTSDYNRLTATKQTNSGATGTSVGNEFSSSYPKSESTIWSYDASTKRFAAKWVNPTGGAISTYFHYSSSLGIIQSSSKTGPSGTDIVYLNFA